jgi:hypothetical protein
LFTATALLQDAQHELSVRNHWVEFVDGELLDEFRFTRKSQFSAFSSANISGASTL